MVVDNDNLPGKPAYGRDVGVGGWKGMLGSSDGRLIVNIYRHVDQSSLYEYPLKPSLCKITKHNISYERHSMHWTI